MNVFTMVKRMQKEASKTADRLLHGTSDDIEEFTRVRKQQYEILWRQNLETYVDAMQFMQEAKELAIERGVIEAPTSRTYFITIRPDYTKLAFRTFYDTVKIYMERECFEWYYLSFEQKGTCDEELGAGYHVHIVAKMKQRSKGEVLRITKSSFKHIVDENYIDVKVCKNPEQVKNDYLLEYKSNDGHKVVTKPWDDKWRSLNNLEQLYTDVEGMPSFCRLTSPVAAEDDTIKVTFD